jgi:hypothetical protein
MLPSQIDSDVFDLIKKEIDSSTLKFEIKSENISTKIDNLLEYCYKEDTNIIPSIYRLLGIDSIIPGFDYEVTRLICNIILKY